MSSLTPVRYSKKIFYVEAVQVTEENMAQIAEWCAGELMHTKQNTPPSPFIKVPVAYPKNDRQTRAFINDYVVKADNNHFRVYPQRAFLCAFEPTVASVEDDKTATYVTK